MKSQYTVLNFSIIPNTLVFFFHCLFGQVLICAIIWNSVVKISHQTILMEVQALLFLSLHGSYLEWLPALENLPVHFSDILYIIYIFMSHSLILHQVNKSLNPFRETPGIKSDWSNSLWSQIICVTVILTEPESKAIYSCIKNANKSSSCISMYLELLGLWVYLIAQIWIKPIHAI